MRSKKLALPTSNPWPKKDFATFVLNKLEIIIEATRRMDIVDSEFFGNVKDFFSRRWKITHNIPDIRTPKTIIIVFDTSIDAYEVDKNTKGENMRVIRNTIKEAFSI